ncbi:MAG: GT4 family glycosyltransferase PelF [Myxococcota bacterium]
MSPPQEKPAADVCLLLEGTYPYVRGGVSSWIHGLVSSLPELTFSTILFGGARSDFEDLRYELPPNLVHLEVHYLADAWQLGRPHDRLGNPKHLAASETVHDWFRSPVGACPTDALHRILGGFGLEGEMTREDFLYGRAVWDNIREAYLARATTPSFIDYFWTVRIMHAPLFLVAEVARGAPPARVYHAISTGYAGLLGVFLEHQRRRPFVLTEHGIYTKERKIDLSQAAWIKDAPEPFSSALEDDVGYIRRLWIRFFEGIGRLAYQAADPIIALYDGNRQRQVRDGAPEERTLVVPNGIDIERFRPALEARTEDIPKVVGLIGRVVPIKDIKTFIRAMRTLLQVIPQAEAWIVGPTDEDREYAAECVDLVESLGLRGKIRFLGFQRVEEILPQLGLMVLSSISEAMPLVVVEGFAAGLPSVTTDVGACRELIYGMGPEDRALGAAGAVVDIADPEGLGTACGHLLSDPARWRRAQAAGLERVNRYYSAQTMVGRYRDIYREAFVDGEEI